MIPILYKTITEGTVPSDYGVGVLTDCITCDITEQRNGEYELVMTYAATGIHAEDIAVESVIKAKPNFTDDPQLFRIYKVGKVLAGKFTVNAHHISYDLSGKVIKTGSASSCVAACALLSNAADNFTINTDKSTAAQFSVLQPASVRSWFGGKEGSLLDIYGGEWKYDNFTATLYQNRGADRGATIRYGKNLTALSQEIDTSNLVTGIIPFYVDPDGNITTGSRVATGLNLGRVQDVAIDFSIDINPDSSTTILNQLANLANRYKNNNNLTVPINSITLSFEQLQELTERVDLCDTVKIYFEALGIEGSAKCIKTIWDVLHERYTSTTFGDARTNIADALVQQQKELAQAPSTSFMSEAIARATELITGNLGGYVVMHDSNNDGEPDEILVMNTPNISTATKVWRWNKEGLGYSSTGYSGSYGTAITSDGKIVANYVATGTLNANLIKAGVLSDLAGNFSLNMTNGNAVMSNFNAKNSFSLLNASNVAKGDMYISGGNTYLMLYPASANTPLVKIWAQDANGAGVFNLLKSNNKVIVEAGSAWNGGGITIRNSTEAAIGAINTGAADGGTFYIANSSGTITIYGDGDSGNLRCVSLTQTSSRKVKENIKPIEDSGKILELNAVQFDYKNHDLGTDKRGFIAEDVEKILPNLVTPETDTTPTTLDYISMIPYLQDVIKKQEARIKVLEEKIDKIGG